MLFAIICRDKPNHLSVRQANRQAHLDYVDATGCVALGGPFITDDGAEMTGSLLVLDVEDRAAAQNWAEGDPYAKAGLFESVEITAWKRLLG